MGNPRPAQVEGFRHLADSVVLGMNTTYASDPTDAKWVRAQRHLPPLSRHDGPHLHSLRRILDATFYVPRMGCAWRHLPAKFRPRQTVFYQFLRSTSRQ